MNEQTYRDEQLKALGLDPTKLTEAQIDIVLQPIDAPENYHHDGEVSASQAKSIWKRKMIESGFTSAQSLTIAIKYKL